MFFNVSVMAVRSGLIKEQTATSQLFVSEALEVIIDNNRYVFAVKRAANFRADTVLVTSL
jgi:hypothetical protein